MAAVGVLEEGGEELAAGRHDPPDVVETSQNAYKQDLARTKNVLGRPIEVLNSASQLVAARQDLVRAMIGSSQAQLQLYTALGNQP